MFNLFTNQHDAEEISEKPTPETNSEISNQPKCITDLIDKPTGYYEYFYINNFLKYKYLGFFVDGFYRGNGTLYVDREDGHGFVVLQSGFYMNGCLIKGYIKDNKKIYTGKFSTRQKDLMLSQQYRCLKTVMSDINGKVEFLDGNKCTFIGRVIMGDIVGDFDEGYFTLPIDQKLIDDFDIGSMPFHLADISNNKYTHTPHVKDTFKKDIYNYTTDNFSYLGNMQYYQLNGVGRLTHYNGSYEEGLFLNNKLVKGVSTGGYLTYTGTFDEQSTLIEGTVDVNDDKSKLKEDICYTEEVHTEPEFKFVIPDNCTLKDIMKWDSNTFLKYFRYTFPKFPPVFFDNFYNYFFTIDEIHHLVKSDYLELGLTNEQYLEMTVTLQELVNKYK